LLFNSKARAPLLAVVVPIPPVSHKTPKISETAPLDSGFSVVEAHYETKAANEDVPNFWALASFRVRKPKKLVVKGCDFPYQFVQMHRVGAGVNCFYPYSVVYKKRVPKLIN
jgi:hypothetical protein